MVKYGEIPHFGEPRPNIIQDVLDDELGFLDRGIRAETAGLGIGAYAYYRRFVEDHKDKIFAQIRDVAVAQAQPQDMIDAINRAMKRREFKAAVEEMKDSIPDSLRINGENPLTLLHDALSTELHGAEDDVLLLEDAQDIRTVLAGLVERTKQALKSKKELNDAVTRMSQKRSARAAAKSQKTP